MLNSELKQIIESALSEKLHLPVSITDSVSIGGGCINDCYKIKTSSGNFFLKYNDAKRYPEMFEAEAKGLHILKKANEIYIPEVISYGEESASGGSFLILEYIESGKKNNFFENFGKRLARQHKYSSEKFGLDHNNYIGSLPQSNKFHDNWNEFFILERLEKQIQLARNFNRIDHSTMKQFNNLFKHIEEIFPNENPALLHGDLWSGNYLTTPDGAPCVIDPAVYYGHREMDIGMTKLFGGFSPEFYDSYNEHYPLEKGWQQRIDVANLYPLMVHVNLFGGSYLMQVQSVLKRFG